MLKFNHGQWMRCATKLAAALCLAATGQTAFAAIAQAPLLQAQSVAPLVLLTLGRDEKLYNAAYNDYSDIDSNGEIDVGYKPSIQYFGYFDSFKCYTYASKLFTPASVTSNKKCSGMWSGDFLNYITTSRVDALRRVLYGGKRITDSNTQTILERSYIPQDAHTWGREYDATVDAYLISDYTPLAQPTTGTRHFFANTSLNGTPAEPLMRVLLNRPERIWNWVAKEGPVAGGVLDGSGASVSPTDYVVRVVACVTGLLEAECKGYPASAPTKYKPTGVLHDYGEGRTIAFGLLSGSFANQRAGGVLRKNISYFDDEVDLSTGRFTSVTGIVYHIDQLKIAQWGPSYPGNCLGGNCKDYGSPTAEMMYEGLRYFGGATTPTPEFDYTDSGSLDKTLGLKKTTWTNPYRSVATGGFPYCAKPVQMVVSDVYPSYDSDQLPGSAFAAFSAPATPTTLSSMSVQAIAATITSAEAISGKYFVGESLDNLPISDRSPSLKTVASLGRIRGLAPGEATRQGSYYSASVARFGKTNDVSPAQGNQKVTTYAIALSAPLPKLSFTYAGAKVALIPFAQSTGGCNYGDFSAATTPMQNRIAAFFIDRIVNVPGFATDLSAATGNSGRPYGRFRVSFEDNTEGTDNDMDAIAVYTFAIDAAGKLSIQIDSTEYSAGCIDQSMGFIVAGTTQDGTYLGVHDLGGGCNASPLHDSAYSTAPAKCAGGLGLLYSRAFTLATSSAQDANIPRDPLFYAAKWGGPGVNEDTDAAATETTTLGIPSVPGYFYVNDPQKLRAQLTLAFSEISKQGAPTTAAVATGAFVRTNSALFLPGYDSQKLTVADAEAGDATTTSVVGSLVWDGTLTAKKFTTTSTGVSLTPLWAVSNASFPAVNSAAKTTSRKVYTKIGTNLNALFLPANLDTAMRTTLATSTAQALLSPYLTAGGFTTTAAKQNETADQVAMYILGNRTLEVRKGGTLRTRRALLGDIVNSTPVYQAKLDEGWGGYTTSMSEATSYGAYVNGKSAATTLYVGANDGMMHAFNAADGSERWAYIPTAVQSNLPFLVDPGYSHRYFVDGALTVSDAYVGGAWKSILVGVLGAGGKSVFGIDVTNPASPTILWEYSNEDLGYVLSKPQIVRLRDGKWVAIVANGYESLRGGTTTVGRMFVLDLANGASLGTISNLTVANQGITNGLGAPAIKLRDGIAEAAWVGDLAGNLWKYDLGADTATSTAGAIKVAYAGVPLFTAKIGTVPQPITSEPSLVQFFDGGNIVVFGTGKFYEVSDVSSTAAQSIYGIWDYSNWNGLTRTDLAAATITDTGNYRFFTGTTGWWALTTPKRGWYANLPISGERVVAPSSTLFGKTIISSLIADSTDPCVISKDGLLMALSPFTGGNPTTPVFDINGDGVVNASDVSSGNPPGGVRLTDPVSLVAVNSGGSAVGYDAKGNAQIVLKGSKPQGRRSWRQVR